MDLNIIIGSVLNKSLGPEIHRIFRELIKKDSEEPLNICELRFYSYELSKNKILKWNLVTIKVSDVNDLTLIKESVLVSKILNERLRIVNSKELGNKNILDEIVYLDIIFNQNTPVYKGGF